MLGNKRGRIGGVAFGVALTASACSWFPEAEPVPARPSAEDAAGKSAAAEIGAVEPELQTVPEWYSLDSIVPSNPVGDVQPQPVLSDRASLVGQLTEGKYLVESVAACGVCHAGASTGARAMPGGPLSGGRMLTDSNGTIAVPNITPDLETGIGTWSVAEIMQALRSAIGKDKRPLSLDVHWGYRWLSDKNARSISMYLLAQRPVKNQVERRDLGVFARKKMGFITRHSEVEGYVPELPGAQAIEQLGRYIAVHAAACGQCHTAERGDFSNLTVLSGTVRREDRSFIDGVAGLGAMIASVGQSSEDQLDETADASGKLSEPLPLVVPPGAPNIRGKSAEGLKSWSSEQIVEFLGGGKTPKGDQVVDCPVQFYQGMAARDKQAIAKYLKSL